MGIIGPVSYGWRDGVVDNTCDGLVVGVLEAQRSCAFGGSVYAVFGVLVKGAFREEEAEGVVKYDSYWGAVAQGDKDTVKCFSATTTGSTPAAIGYCVGAWGTVFGLFQEVFNVVDGGESGFTEVNGYAKIAGKDLCEFAVDVLFGKGSPQWR